MMPPGYQPGADTDEGGLWMEVGKMEDQIKTSPKVIGDPALNSYVHGVICKLAGDYCSSLRVYVVEVPEFNASAMPNGAMQVNSGLLLECENEAQLAFVLGHEMTHFLHQHTLAHFRKVVDTGNFLAFLNIAAGGAGVGAVGSLITDVAVLSLFANSRDEERDADDGGFKAAVAQGYDPDQAATIWRFVANEDKATGKYRNPFLSDHPPSAERLATMEKSAKDVLPSRSDWTTNADTYRAVMAPFQAQWVSDDLARGEPRWSVALFERLTADQPQKGLFHYALGEAYRKRGNPGDVDKAKAAYQAATACDDAPAATWRGLGLIAMAAGDKPAAHDAFTQYEAKAPAADDKSMIDFYLTQL
jgi:beta-barrel assembly-enhancing protease